MRRPPTVAAETWRRSESVSDVWTASPVRAESKCATERAAPWQARISQDIFWGAGTQGGVSHASDSNSFTLLL